MAIGKASDFTIYQDEFHEAVTETLEQETMAFNEASGGAITLATENLMGDYEKSTFFKTVSNLITRRDTTSTSAATDLALTQGENVRVKLNRKIGPVANTLDSFRKILMGLGDDPESQQSTFSFMIGEQVAKALMVDYLNSALRAASAAITNVAALTNTATGGTITHSVLNSGFAKFGDAAQNVNLLVMHSKPYFDLVGQAITDKIFGVANVTIDQGSVATMGRRVLVTDSAPLLNATASPDQYTSLGLVPGAITVTESEGQEIFADLVTGLENLVVRIQGEHAFTIGVMGYTWDVTNGGANPNDTALGTGSNWDKVATDNRSTAGIAIITQ